MSAEFTLPSGRVLQVHEPTFGEQLKALTKVSSSEDIIYAKFAVVFPEMLRPEIEALRPADGNALLEEMNRIWLGRGEAASVPLNNGGAPSSTDSSLLQMPLPPES